MLNSRAPTLLFCYKIFPNGVLCTEKFTEGARGAACSNSRPQPGAKTFGGLEGGGGGGGVGGSAGQPPGSVEGGQWVPQHTLPQHDPHDALIIWNIHKWDKKNFQKKIAH